MIIPMLCASALTRLRGFVYIGRSKIIGNSDSSLVAQAGLEDIGVF